MSSNMLYFLLNFFFDLEYLLKVELLPTDCSFEVAKIAKGLFIPKLLAKSMQVDQQILSILFYIYFDKRRWVSDE
jgi:hypothetical protein